MRTSRSVSIAFVVSLSSPTTSWTSSRVKLSPLAHTPGASRVMYIKAINRKNSERNCFELVRTVAGHRSGKEGQLVGELERQVALKGMFEVVVSNLAFVYQIGAVFVVQVAQG